MFDPPYPPYDPTDPKWYSFQLNLILSNTVLTSPLLQLFVSNTPFQPKPLPIPIPHSFDTLVRRWPVILTTIIDHLYRVGHELATKPNDDLSPATAEARIEAGKSVIEKISKLKYDMGRDKPLLYDSITYLSFMPAMLDTNVFLIGHSTTTVRPLFNYSIKSWPPWKNEERTPGLPLRGCTRS